ncbi:MAG: hypothetical protein Q4F21_14885 [Lachnospiraceae bacterium]|nr:hypothetical protein [Lachnospiraceae bacterium]
MNGYYTTEIDEAIVAGRSAVQALNRAESALEGARSFGLWDMFGGGFISGMMKHSKMNDAQYELENAQRELARFKKELSDVQMTGTINIRFDGLVKFVDLFCDNVLVDMMVQSKIKDMLNHLRDTRAQVEQTIRRLEQYKSGG